MATKPKLPQKEHLDGTVNERDIFQTPNYAIDLLIPFIPKYIHTVWEYAAGMKKITNRLMHHGYDVVSTDLQYDPIQDFLTYIPSFNFDCMITNDPFSLKSKFYKRRMKYVGVPWAVLLPADYSGWICEAILMGCEKIVPSKRIDFLTPNILNIVCRGETFIRLSKLERSKYDNKPKNFPRELWNLDFMYPSIWECPNELLAKWSTSQFHSMWLTWGFKIGKSETIVELTTEMKKNI